MTNNLYFNEEIKSYDLNKLKYSIRLDTACIYLDNSKTFLFLVVQKKRFIV